jgi:KUP system potassium uptake protein
MPAAPETPPPTRRPGRREAGIAALTLGALGVVFGDIGTSPLYALQTVFSADHHAVKPTDTDVYGVISLVFWAITMIVTFQFVTFIMRADNDGEGGIMALIALISNVKLRSRRTKLILIGLGLFGVSLFYGDGMITPAISVLSAVEGLEVVTPSLHDAILPITIAVLTALFLIQRFGTHVVGRLFGPVMVVWFAVIGLTGLAQIVDDPAILKALSPGYGVEFFTAHPGIAFIALASIVLTVTGAEALYADMGHFGRPPIRRAWFLFVFPALTLNYMGQGSLILESSTAIANPFFLLVPSWGRVAMVVLATVATVIASQAVISGAFSVTHQAVQLGFLPRMTVRHTSSQEAGQVYAPAVNWALFVAVIVLVIGFGSSARLASAYGIAVTGTITIDALLFLVVARTLWHKPLWMAIVGGAVFLTIDLAFLTANFSKVLHGGWFPIGVGLVMFVVLSTWDKGRERVLAKRVRQEGKLQTFVDDLAHDDPPVARVPGTAVYLNQRSDTTPLALKVAAEHTHVLHESVVVVTLAPTRAPHVGDHDRVIVDQLGHVDDGIVHLTARYGYLDSLDVPKVLRRAGEQGLVERPIDVEHATYFMSQAFIVATGSPGMARWRKRLFVALWRNASSPIEYFRLPPDRTVIVGAEIPI